ncbi:MAG TPA: hypothetical protein VFN41_04730, partial [Candidatus Limnocylindrales bacterium]|nr:hypothetical protein [Candidatus Limnocylindrales bacterium]
ASVVTESGCGILVDPTDPSAIARACREILAVPPDEAVAWSRRIRAAAHDTYNWERQAEVLFQEYGRLTGRPW